jgi:hypothetical protein
MKHIWLLWMNDALLDVFEKSGDAISTLATLKDEIANCTWECISKDFWTGEVRWANDKGIARLEVERREVK